MTRRRRVLFLVLATLGASVLALPTLAMAQPVTFKVVGGPSRATFKNDAPLETVVGTASGPAAVLGNVAVDPAKPQSATGQIKVDLHAVKTGIDKRDADMRGKDFLDSEANEANRWATFDIKSVEIMGPLEPGKDAPAKVHGTFTVKGKPVEKVADARVTYIKLTPEQLESQKRFGFAAENVRVRATFDTKFTDHDMKVPQLLFLKVSNDIKIETDLTLARQ